ncbi:PIG-L family deacetylase [Hanamia caeni]|uniref:PIG-L family deacetylase n=1 Tax=Hanamia caeni TaxID=2294116 RepID=A0A3M9NCX2_9BACT|nr:PIG-L family deacetylase [Hanamia caeni]RNI35672.1 PIG-L family deacetylase [Hanamia caeni]
MRRYLFLFFLFSFSHSAFSQAPKQFTSDQIFQQIKKLNVLGSILYVAAHPDDENTRLLAYLANGKLYRTGYLSMTRGDGGQNLIGDEQGSALGLIRTQELLAARRIDGAEQFFTRAFDFGFTKSPVETFQFWNEQKILSDVVWVIRKFQPDVIITRFPTTGEGGHGHHTASAILAGEAFEAAADSSKFPEQFKYGVKPWQAKRLLWNTFNFGSVNTESPDQFKIDVGGYNPLLGESYGEIAAKSRSQHKTQGFGVPSSRGKQLEYFKTIKGSNPREMLMDGVNTTWQRINEQPIGDLIQKLMNDYSFQEPQKSLPQLLSIYKSIAAMPQGYWRDQKLEQVKQIMKECIGLYMEATTNTMFAVQGEPLHVNFVADKRLGGDVTISSIVIRGKEFSFNDQLPLDENVSHSVTVLIPSDAKISQPYWLVEPMNKGSYNVSEQTLIGKPENDPQSAEVNLSINGQELTYTLPIRYKSNDPVKGETYEPLFVIPKVEVKSNPELALAINDTPVDISVKAFSNGASQNRFTLHEEHSQNVLQTKKGNVSFYSIKNPLQKDHEVINWSASLGNENYNQYKTIIEYPHIPNIIYFKKASSDLVSIPLKISGKKVGYIPGAGDKVPEALQKMGYEVAILSPKDITANNLKQYDAIVTGVRAYNIFQWLNDAYNTLMNYVKDGGVLLVQYNTNNNIGPIKAKIGPYPFNITRTRVTDENADVKFVDRDNTLLNYPNKITEKDFDNWIQERSTYQADDFEKNYKALFEMSDANESPSDGSLIYTNYGKGRFVYSGLVFFRELPAGVPGAYRLFANLLAKPEAK